MKKNCWEFKKCGMHKAKTAKRCAVPSMTMYDGINEGRNGGRVCWMIAGSACEGGIQGTFAQKLETCATCDFYKYVQSREGEEITLPLDIIEGMLSKIK